MASMWGLAVLGARLRWRLVRNRLRKGGLAMFVVMLVGCAGWAVFGFSTLAVSRIRADVGIRQSAAIYSMAFITAMWVLMPMLTGGVDETVDPTRLALVPLNRRELGAVMAGGALASPVTMATAVVFFGLIPGFARGVAGTVIILVLVPSAYVLAMGLSRCVAALLARAQRSRRGKDAAAVMAALVGAAIWLGVQLIAPLARGSGSPTGRRIAAIIGWTPIGIAGRTAAEVTAGNIATALLCLALTIALGVAAVAGWWRATARLLEGSGRVANGAFERRGEPLGEARTEFAAALRRELLYNRRSPSKRVQLLMGGIMGVAFGVLQALNSDSPDDRIVFLGTTGIVFTLASAFNLIGWDSPTLWLEEMTGGLTQARLAARGLGWLPHLLAPGLLGVPVVALITGGRWRFVPLALMTTTAVAGIALSVGVMLSVRVGYPAEDGDNPFSMRHSAGGRGCTYGLVLALGILLLGLANTPMAVVVVAFADRWWAYAVTVLWNAVAVGLFISATSRAARRVMLRGPELIAELSPRSVV